MFKILKVYCVFFALGVADGCSDLVSEGVSVNANQTTYTVCSTIIDGNPVKALMMGKEIIGWTSAFQGQRVLDLASEFGQTFYFLTNSESIASANTTLWAVHPSHDLIRITTTATDGWILTIIAVYSNRLYAIGYMPPSLTRYILTFGDLPNRPTRPMILSGISAVPRLVSTPDIVWSDIRSSVSSVSSVNKPPTVQRGVKSTVFTIASCCIGILYLLYSNTRIKVWHSKSPYLPTRTYTKQCINPTLLKQHMNSNALFQPVKANISSAVSPHIKEQIGFTAPKENDV